MKPIRKGLLTAAALLGGVCISSAGVTPQFWDHMGDGGASYLADSSGNSRNISSAFSHHPNNSPTYGGNANGFITATGVGGPLGTSGYTSTTCTRFGSWNWITANMWNASGYVPPPSNYFIEIWVQPYNRGFSGGSTHIFTSGTGGNALYLQCIDEGGTNSLFRGNVGGIGYAGGQMSIDTNSWTHLALVNDNGVVTFYTNGVACGDSVSGLTTAVSGEVYFGSPGGWQGFDGLMDEARICTFDAGSFTTDYFLLPPPGPQILAQPQSASVWSGGAAPFAVNAALDSSVTFQWKRDGTTVGSASEYYLNTVGAGDNSAEITCVLKDHTGLSKTSSVATLTVVSVNPANVAAYQNAVRAQSSLLAYYTCDSDTGTTLTDTKGSNNGKVEGAASYDGRINRAFGVRALRLNGNGDVAIPNNTAFEFGNGSGNGTIEAIVFMDQSRSAGYQTIFSEAYNDGTPLFYYQIQASADGRNLVYTNDSGSGASWSVAPSLVGRQAHVAVVFANNTVTAYVDGQSLGSKPNPTFGTAGSSAYIGSAGLNSPVPPAANSPPPAAWIGTIDELAVYTSALSQNTIQQHYSALVYGTNTAPPSIVSQPSSKTLLAGGCPVLVAKASGTLPLLYQWSSNGVPISGAVTATLSLSNVTTSATYSLNVENAYGNTNTQPIELTVVAPPSGYPAMVLNDHPTAFWRMSDTNGQPALDSVGFNDGAYAASGVTYGVPAHQGESGTAVAFNGSSGRAIVPNTSVLNPAGPFTIELWVSTPQGGWTGTGANGFMVPFCSMDRPGRSGGYEFYLDGNYTGYEFHTAVGGGYSTICGDNYIPIANEWSHIVGVYDGTSIAIYVNGVQGSDSPYPETITPNSVTPFIIGSRADNVRFWEGPISDVAFYNYALSATQISNHWSSAYAPAAITMQPVGVTNNELSTVTLTAKASGLPNTYQWYRNGVALDPAKTSFDGTVHYPGGVTSKTLTIAKPTTADAGQYHMAVINAFGNAQTIDVTVALTIIDTTPPNVVSAASMGNTSGGGAQTVDIQFDKILDLGGTDPIADPGTARNAANYTFVSPSGATVTTAELRTSGTAVRLTVSGLLPATTFTVKVANVRDWTRRASNAIPPAGQTVSGAVQSLMTYTTDVGSFTPPGTTYTMGPGEYEVETGGTDIWGNTDGFHYGFREVSGDFDVSAQVAEVNGNQRAGIMLREGGYGFTDAGAKFNNATFYQNYYVAFHARETAGVGPVWVNPPYNNWIPFGAAPNVWLRLKRVGDLTSAYYGTDGLNWTPMGTTTNIIQDPALLGLATCNSSLTKYAHYGITVIHPVLNVSNAGGQLTISWTETGTLLQSTNVTLPSGQWTVVPGTSPYVVTPAPGSPQMFYRVRQ